MSVVQRAGVQRPGGRGRKTSDDGLGHGNPGSLRAEASNRRPVAFRRRSCSIGRQGRKGIGRACFGGVRWLASASITG